jgi:hypothetical protein
VVLEVSDGQVRSVAAVTVVESAIEAIPPSLGTARPERP